jgi:hypothetical protein
MGTLPIFAIRATYGLALGALGRVGFASILGSRGFRRLWTTAKAETCFSFQDGPWRV